MTMIENKHFNCTKIVSCKVMTFKTQKRYRWYLGHLGLLGGVGDIRGCWRVSGCWGCTGGLAGSVGTEGPVWV